MNFYLEDTGAKVLLCPPDGAEAARKAKQEHDLTGAAAALDAILRDACAIGAPA